MPTEGAVLAYTVEKTTALGSPWTAATLGSDYTSVLTDNLDTVAQIRATRNPGLAIEGILRTMHDPRNNLANQVSTQLVTHFNEEVYRTIIPRNVRLAEAPSHGQPALLYDKASRGSIAYLALASEVIRRQQKRQAATA